MTDPGAKSPPIASTTIFTIDLLTRDASLKNKYPLRLFGCFFRFNFEDRFSLVIPAERANTVRQDWLVTLGTFGEAGKNDLVVRPAFTLALPGMLPLWIWHEKLPSFFFISFGGNDEARTLSFMRMGAAVYR
jgi:hypothetical protein